MECTLECRGRRRDTDSCASARTPLNVLAVTALKLACTREISSKTAILSSRPMGIKCTALREYCNATDTIALHPQLPQGHKLHVNANICPGYLFTKYYRFRVLYGIICSTTSNYSSSYYTDIVDNVCHVERSLIPLRSETRLQQIAAADKSKIGRLNTA